MLPTRSICELMLYWKIIFTTNHNLLSSWKSVFKFLKHPENSQFLREKFPLAVFPPFSWSCLPNLWHMGISHLVNIFSCSLWHETLIIRRIYTSKIDATAGDIYQLELQFCKTLYTFSSLPCIQSNYLW